ncbi:superinfection exclusion B family protein [Pseudomonadota bacterium]
MMKMKLKAVNLVNIKRVLVSTMLWLVIACAVLLVAPQHVLETLSLSALVSDYGHFIGLGLIVGAAFFLSQLFTFVVDESIGILKEKRAVETIEAKVKLLDPAERALLREFFLQGATILALPQNELAVKGLVDSNILELVGNERHYAIQGPTAEYKISMKARLYLNREVLRLPAGEPSKEELNHLIKARPQFVNGLVQSRKHVA